MVLYNKELDKLTETYYQAQEDALSSLYSILEDELTNPFKILNIGFDDGLFTIKIASEELYEDEIEHLEWKGLDLKKTRGFTNIIHYTFVECEF